MYIKKVNYWNHSNKLKCVSVDNQESPLISIDIWCKAGVSFESENKGGTAHFLEHMIFKGTSKLLPGEFDYRIESFGGSSNASTGYDDSHYYVLIPPDNFRESLSLLTNLVLLPKIDRNEFEKEKLVVIEEIKQQNDQPDEILFNLFLKKVWVDNVYSNTILGEEESIRALSLEDLWEFHSNRYSLNNLAIAVSGKIPSDIKIIFEDCNINERYSLISQKDQQKFDQKIKNGREIIKFDKLEFSRIFMAWQIPCNHYQKLIVGFEVLTSILVDGKNSKLVKPLKEQNNLVESIDVDVNAGEFGSLLILETCCDKENLYLVEEKINEILDKLLNHPDELKHELRKSINIIKSNYFFNLETSSQLSAFYGNNLLWDRYHPLHELEDYLDYWNNVNNFKEILRFLLKDKYTLIVEAN